MVSIKTLAGRLALVAGILSTCAAWPAAADLSECLEGCRQQVCADREACEDLLEQQRAEIDRQVQACVQEFPAQSTDYGACMMRVASARLASSAEYRRCINLANTAGAACARSCSPSPSEPFPVPAPGPFQICP